MINLTIDQIEIQKDNESRGNRAVGRVCCLKSCFSNASARPPSSGPPYRQNNVRGSDGIDARARRSRRGDDGFPPGDIASRLQGVLFRNSHPPPPVLFCPRRRWFVSPVARRSIIVIIIEKKKEKNNNRTSRRSYSAETSTRTARGRFPPRNVLSSALSRRPVVDGGRVSVADRTDDRRVVFSCRERRRTNTTRAVIYGSLMRQQRVRSMVRHRTDPLTDN